MQEVSLAGENRPVLFAHFHVGDGSATVALIESDGDLHYGLSFCSPKDMFCKREGRNRAAKRLHVHLVRRGNGLFESKQAGTFHKIHDVSRSERFETCLLAVYRELGRQNPPKWTEEASVEFRSSKKRKVVSDE